MKSKVFWEQFKTTFPELKLTRLGESVDDEREVDLQDWQDAFHILCCAKEKE